MAANTNKVGQAANSGTWPTGTKLNPEYEKLTDDTSDAGLPRSIGSAIATDGGNTTSKLKHRMVADMVDDSVTVTRATVGNTAALALATRVAACKWLIVHNEGPSSCYYGTANTITTNATMATKGTTIRPGAIHVLRWGPRLSLYAIKLAAATATLRLQEKV